MVAERRQVAMAETHHYLTSSSILSGSHLPAEAQARGILYLASGLCSCGQALEAEADYYATARLALTRALEEHKAGKPYPQDSKSLARLEALDTLRYFMPKPEASMVACLRQVSREGESRAYDVYILYHDAKRPYQPELCRVSREAAILLGKRRNKLGQVICSWLTGEELCSALWLELYPAAFRNSLVARQI